MKFGTEIADACGGGFPVSIASTIGFQLFSARPLRLMRDDRQATRVGILLLMVIILNAVDLAYTLYAHNMHLLTEVNPLANSFLRLNFTQGLVCYKLVMVLSGCMMLWKLRASRWAGVGCWLLVLVYTGLAVLWCVWMNDVTKSDEMLALISPTHYLAR